MGFIRTRFLSFAMVGGVCFLLLVSLTVESLLRGLSDYLKNMLPGGHILALALFLVFDLLKRKSSCIGSEWRPEALRFTCVANTNNRLHRQIGL
jgi:hypothetical protein